jgi:hypothetical protein
LAREGIAAAQNFGQIAAVIALFRSKYQAIATDRRTEIVNARVAMPSHASRTITANPHACRVAEIALFRRED